MTPTETRDTGGDSTAGQRRRKAFAPIGLGVLLLSLALVGFVASRPEPERVPARVSLVGTIEPALGCELDAPACAATSLEPQRIDRAWFEHLTAPQRRFLVPTQAPTWRRTLELPAGDFTYRVRADELVYGAAGRIDGPPMTLHLDTPRAVTFLYSHESHGVMNDAQALIVVASGTFQRQLGCANDWQDDCLRAWLPDFDGDRQFSLVTRLLARGEYQVRPAVDGHALEGARTTWFKVLRDAEEVRFVWRREAKEIVVEFPGGRPEELEP